MGLVNLVVKNAIPDGTRDLINEESVIKRKIIKDINDVFESWGYSEVITPTIEFYETFRGNDSALKEDDMYKFFDNKGRILVLRPDMTVPIARVVNTKFKNRDEVLRLRYESNVYRVNEELFGKRNEYTDCGIELISSPKYLSELEVLMMAIETFKSIGVSDYRLEIGVINFFKSAVDLLDLSEEDYLKLGELIEKKRLKDLDNFLIDLNISQEIKEFFTKLPLLFGNANEVLEKCKELAFNENMRESINDLENIFNKLDELGYADKISFDLGMIPKLNYYTGIIFRGFVQGLGNTVLSGGRYDNLMKSLNSENKAVGFSVNVDELIRVVNFDEEEKEVYKILFNEGNEIEALKESLKLRNCGKISKLILSDDVEGVVVTKER